MKENKKLNRSTKSIRLEMLFLDLKEAELNNYLVRRIQILKEIKEIKERS